jgi:hypothetical protein
VPPPLEAVVTFCCDAPGWVKRDCEPVPPGVVFVCDTPWAAARAEPIHPRLDCAFPAANERWIEDARLDEAAEFDAPFVPRDVDEFVGVDGESSDGDR